MTAATTGTRGSARRTLHAPRSAAERLGTRVPRGWLIVGALLPLVLLGAWAALALSRGPSGASIGTTAPAFAVADLDGNPLRLEDLRGRPVIVNFWASWCGPCVDEFPLLRDAAARHGTDDLALVGIVFRDNSEAARRFMVRMGAGWPAAMDPGEEIAEAYGIYGPPETFFIDAEGVVVARQIGVLSRGDLDRHLSRLLGEGATR
jgi:cytochrome c biogenesis protein CcmG/thiol:disulfide interchange protein DsbE